MKNRERLNRLLLLFQLEANGLADERRYAKTIRAWLEPTGGRPTTPRREIADPGDRPSLRDAGANSAARLSDWTRGAPTTAAGSGRRGTCGTGSPMSCLAQEIAHPSRSATTQSKARSRRLVLIGSPERRSTCQSPSAPCTGT